MAQGNINLLMGCESCRFSDAYGRGRQHGLLFPVLSFISGNERCPNFESKTTEQINEQLKIQRK